MNGGGPSLDAIADHPVLARGLAPEQIAALLARAAAALVALASAEAARSPARQAHPVSDDDILGTDQIARQLGVRRAWLFRHLAELPIARVSRKGLSARRGDLIAWREGRKKA